MLLCLCRFCKYFYWIYVKQRTSQLSVKATAFPRYLLKPTLFMLFKFDSCFFSCCSLTYLIFHKLPLSWHVSWHSQVVIILSERKKKSTGYSCTWICFDIYLNISIFVTRITKLRRARRSELALRSADFRALGNLTFVALSRGGIDPKFPQITRFAKKDVHKFDGRLYWPFLW